MTHRFPFEQFIKLDDNTDSQKTNQSDLEKSVEKKQEETIFNSFSSEEFTELTYEVKSQLKKDINPDKFRAYFEETFYISQITATTITCNTTTSFLKRIIENQYLDYLENVIKNTLGKKYSIKIETTSDLKETSPNPPAIPLEKNSFETTQKTLKPTTEDLNHAVKSQVIEHFNQDGDIHTGLLSDKNFDNFISGPSNKMSYAAAIAVANKPGETYPSLFIHGGSGLGKTHLLHAIGNQIQKKYPRKKIILISASAFTNEMVNHLQNKTLPLFRKKYSQDIDVLIIDDIHELKNKSFTQDEFFHVFNELYKQKKQLIFTSDKHPKKIDGLTERIKTRLYWGLVTDIQQPDFETRIAILKQKAQDADINLSDDVANIIASSIKNNIRELEGSLIKLGAYSSINNINIDIELAKEILNFDEAHQKEITYENILEAISDYYEIPIKDILGRSRIKEIVTARHMAMHFCYSHMKATLKEIAHYFGGRDHSSILHGVKKIQQIIKNNEDQAHDIYEIEGKLL